MNPNCGIYLITNIEDGKVYLGSSRRLHKCKTSMGREYEHFQMLKNGKHSNRHLQSAYNQYGREAFQWEVLMYLPEDITDKYLKYWEDYYINFFDALNPKYGYNFLSADRHKVSEETKIKLSISQKGKPKPKPEGFGQKISAAKKGKPLSEDHKEKLRKPNPKVAEALRGKPSPKKGKKTGKPAWNKGLPATEETKKNMSASRKGKPQPRISAAKKGKPWSEARRAAYTNKKVWISPDLTYLTTSSYFALAFSTASSMVSPILCILTLSFWVSFG